MKNTQKRLIAVGVSIVIIILSLVAGTSPESKTSDTASDVAQTTTLNSLLNKSKGTRVVHKEGDSNNTIQVISVDGTIDASMTSGNPYSVINQINMASENPDVRAILLTVNTPGGGVYESVELYNALKNSGKDVYVYMRKQATSGGYYISAAAKKIFANEETITGSIGVVMSSLSAQKFLEDNGIKNQIIRSGEQKAVGGLTEDMPESTLEIYKEINKESYEKFVDVIVKGRNMSREKVLELADGRIYSGTQALKNGLIDGIGTEADVVNQIKLDKGLSNPEIIEYQELVNISLFDQLIGAFAKAVSTEIKSAVADSNKIERSYLG